MHPNLTKFGIWCCIYIRSTPAKFGKNRFRFRYSSHIYISSDFLYILHQYRNLHPIDMKFGRWYSIYLISTPAKFGKNRFRFRYSPHIYITSDFIFIPHQCRNIHPIAMKFGMWYSIYLISTRAKFGKIRFRFRYSRYVYDYSDLQKKLYRSCIFHKTSKKFGREVYLHPFVYA